MSEHRGRPEEFGDQQRDTFVALLEAGLSRRMAARNLGIAPSTVTKRAARDPHFASHIRNAENFRDFELLQRVIRQSERSWRAATWLLERIHPEQFAKGNRGKLGKQGQAGQIGPSADEVFDRIILALREELSEETFQRVEKRLNHLAVHEFADIPYPVAVPGADVEADEACDEAVAPPEQREGRSDGGDVLETGKELEGDTHARRCALGVPPMNAAGQQPVIEPVSVSEMLNKSAEMEKRSREEEALRRYRERRRQRMERRKCRQLLRQGRQPAGGFGRPAVDSVRHLPAAQRTSQGISAASGELFNTSPPAQQSAGTASANQRHEPELFNASPVAQSEGELFNTSPDVHERRVLKNVAG